MIAGALEFTLGLQANQFISSMGLAGGQLASFLGLAGSISAAFHRMWDAVEKGGALKDLAVRTNTSVASLYSLEKAFEQIGASADSAVPLILKLQRQLVDQEGVSVLKSLGLDADQLRGQSSVQQIEAIGAALARLNTSGQSAAAFKLFGREGAATMLQIARSGRDFSDAISAVRGDASIWDKVATRFDALGDKVKEIQGRIQTAFALAAGALIAAFEQGTLGNLITDTIVTAFDVAVALLPAVLMKIGEILINVFKVPLAYLQAGMEYVLEQGISNPKFQKFVSQLLPGASGLFGLSGPDKGPGTTSFSEILAERLKEGFKFDLGTGEFGMGDISGEANTRLNEALAKAGEVMSSFRERLIGLISGLPQGGATAAGAASGAGAFKAAEVTNIEKMGGAIRGLGLGFGGDANRETANNTRQMLGLQKETNRLLADENRQVDYSNQD